MPDSSVSLVTCCQAVHWMNYAAFCEEVDRVLRPSDCVSIFAYGNFTPETCQGDAAIDSKLQKLHQEASVAYIIWLSRRRPKNSFFSCQLFLKGWYRTGFCDKTVADSESTLCNLSYTLKGWYRIGKTKYTSTSQIHIKLTQYNVDDRRKHPMKCFCLKCHIR